MDVYDWGNAGAEVVEWAAAGHEAGLHDAFAL